MKKPNEDNEVEKLFDELMEEVEAEVSSEDSEDDEDFPCLTVQRMYIEPHPFGVTLTKRAVRGLLTSLGYEIDSEDLVTGHDLGEPTEMFDVYRWVAEKWAVARLTAEIKEYGILPGLTD